MSAILTDAEIKLLLDERKPITKAQVDSLHKPRKVKCRRELWGPKVHLIGERGHKFIAQVRWNIRDEMSFSVILSIKRGKAQLNLIRCNGFHAPHLNPLEKTRIPEDTCHIHQITERYQMLGIPEVERFAVATNEYTGFHGAVDFFSWNFGMFVPDDKYKGGLYQGRF